jgi:hypothetical protein
MWGIEASLDRMTSQIYTWALQYSLITWYWITWTAESSFTFLRKSVRGIVDAHIEDAWIFLERNSMPWPTKRMIDQKCELTFYPDRLVFITSGGEGAGERKKKIDDIVTATLLCEEGMIDLSEFFMEVGWTGPGSTPSPLECVVCALLTKQKLRPINTILGYTLDVFTADGVDIHCPLNSEWASRPFAGWPPQEEPL